MKKLLTALLHIGILLCSVVPAMAQSDKYDLANFGWRTVDSRDRGSLVFQKKPRGAFMSGFKYYDGDWIYVNVDWRSQGYTMACEDGTYGYVDASYIDW